MAEAGTTKISLVIADVDGTLLTPDKVQAQADEVTGSCSDEGFAKAMEGFVLRRPNPALKAR